MGEPTKLPTLIDDLGGLYSHASEAFKAGERRGRDDFFRLAQVALGQISAKHGSGPVNGPEALLTTRGFHVAEECGHALRKLKDAFDSRRETV